MGRGGEITILPNFGKPLEMAGDQWVKHTDKKKFPRDTNFNQNSLFFKEQNLLQGGIKPTQDTPAHFAKSCLPDRWTRMQSNRLKVPILLSESLLVSKLYYLIGQCKTQTTDRA